ncbi:MAG: FG-GAP-like repeat-containing protein [Patescibacteria group bacterium]
MVCKFYLFFIPLLFFCLLPVAAKASSSTPSQLKIFDYQGKLLGSFEPLSQDYSGNVDLAVGNLDGGSEPADIIIAQGSGQKPLVSVWDSSGQKKFDFLAYAENFRGGVNVATGDNQADGRDEIFTGAGYGGGPQVRGFQKNYNFLNFFAFDRAGRRGIRLAIVDLGSDNKAEIVVGSGLNEKAKIAIFNNIGEKVGEKNLDFLNSYGGLSLAVGDVNNDGKSEIVLAGGYGNKPEIFILDGKLKVLSKFQAQDSKNASGLNLAVGDVNGDGKKEIVSASSFKGTARITIFDGNGKKLSEFEAYAKPYSYGVKLAVGDVNGDGKKEIVTMPERINPNNLSEAYKYVSVDLSKQVLSQWQNGYLLANFLISSGVKARPTPKGKFTIYKKRPSVRMSWYYGYNNPLNYDLPGVPWVASFYGPYTIHGTYWHHNFGHPMSHGCVNMKTPEAKVIYDWADMGTPVIIY